MIFDVIVLAGTSEKDNELLIREQVPAKPFIKLGEKMFLEHEIDTISKLDFIRDVYISGMSEKDWKTKLSRPVIFDNFQAGIVEKLKHFRHDIYTPETEPNYVIIISGDIPLITKEAIERFIEKCKQTTDGELKALYYMCLVDEKVMNAKFPGSNRHYLKLKDVKWCAGDTILTQPSIIDSHGDVLDQLVNNRKSVFKSLFVLSPMTVFKILIGRLTMAGFNDAINKYLFKQPNSCIGVLADDPELGMDVDKPFHLDIVREYYNKNKKIK